MRSILPLLGFAALYGCTQAASLGSLLARDTCGTSMACNAAGCLGLNNATGTGDSICTEGDCAGQACGSVCGAIGPCNNDGCNGFLQNGADWICSAGDYNGCSCSPICPSADDLPNCSDSSCKGTSNTNDPFGICGLSQYTDCTCKNSCPSSPPSCSDSACLGVNDPNGGKSVCLSGSNLGCECTSSCATGKCNEISGCSGYNNANGNSTCTAGASMGCHCDAICPSQTMSCTANGCQGVQSTDSNGNGFCTAGDYQGCSCAPQCPSTQPSCTDDSCDGINSKCTSQDNWGCACSGNDAAARKRSLPLKLRARTNPPTTYGIPFSYYRCANLPSQPNGGGTVSWASDEIQTAMRQGYIALLNDEQVRGSNGRYYPQRFYWEAGWDHQAGVDVNDLYEFPLTRDAQGRMGFANGQDPGPDRVVFQGINGRFVGVFTHRGETNNRFHQAIGTNVPRNNPQPEYEFGGPTNLDLDPLPWLFGGMSGSSGNLPGKRTTGDTPGAVSSPSPSPSASSSVTAPVCGTGQGSPPPTYSISYGDDAINWFCSQGGTRQVSGSGIRSQGIYGYQDKQGQTTDVALILRMYLINGNGCSATGNEVYQPSIQECKDNFGSTMNNCQTGTGDKGSSYQVFNKGSSGCVAFDLMPCPEVNGAASSTCQPNYGAYTSFKVGG